MEDTKNVALRDRSRNTEGLLSFGVLLVLTLALILVYLAKRPEPPADAILINVAKPETFAAALDIKPELATRIAAYRDTRGGFDSCDTLLDIPLLNRDEADRLAAALTKARINYNAATANQIAAQNFSSLLAARIIAARDAEKAPALFGSPAAPVLAPAPEEPKLAAILRRLPLLDPRTTRPLLPQFMARTPGTVFQHFAVCAVLLLLAVFLAPPWVRARTGGDPFLLPLCLLLTGLGVVLLFQPERPAARRPRLRKPPARAGFSAWSPCPLRPGSRPPPVSASETTATSGFSPPDSSSPRSCCSELARKA